MSYSTVVTRTLQVSRDKLFRALHDFGNLKSLVPDLVESVELSGAGIGMQRRIQIVGAEHPIIERLDAVMPPSLLCYSIVNDAPLPVRHYVAVVRLNEPAPGWCDVEWGSNWVAHGKEPAEVNQLLSGFYSTILSNLLQQMS